MGRKRRKFTQEFKDETARLVVSGGRSIGEVSRDLDLTETAVRAWVHKAKAGLDAGATGSGPGALAGGNQPLRRENKVLRQER
jgi:transposase